MMENQIQEKTCMKTQLFILARMCNYTCIRLQQVLCMHYTHCLKLDGFVDKCAFSYYNYCKYTNCSTVFIYAYVQVFWYIPYVHTQIAVFYLCIIYTHLCLHMYFLLYLVPPDDGSDELNES